MVSYDQEARTLICVVFFPRNRLNAGRSEEKASGVIQSNREMMEKIEVKKVKGERVKR